MLGRWFHDIAFTAFCVLYFVDILGPVRVQFCKVKQE